MDTPKPNHHPVFLVSRVKRGSGPELDRWWQMWMREGLAQSYFRCPWATPVLWPPNYVQYTVWKGGWSSGVISFVHKWRLEPAGIWRHYDFHGPRARLCEGLREPCVEVLSRCSFRVLSSKSQFHKFNISGAVPPPLLDSESNHFSLCRKNR